MTATPPNSLVLTPADWDHVLGRLGYGNPAAPVWFLGMEEGLSKELNVALREFLERPQPFDSFEHMGLSLTHPPRTPPWRIMAKLTRRLQCNVADWDNAQRALEYVVGNLGTAKSDTLLLEMLPLPAKKFSQKPSDWPNQYKSRFSDPFTYSEEMLGKRIPIMRDLAYEHRPRVVFCYGEGYWPHYEAIFPLRDIDVYHYTVKTKSYAAKIGVWEDSTVVVLAPFFVPFKLPNRELGKVAERVETMQRTLSGSVPLL